MKEQAAQGARAALVPFSHTINLGEIAQRLARALLADSHGPLFSVSNNRLLVNPRSVMIAFYKSLQDKPLDFLENPPLGFDKTILLGTGVSTKSHDVSDNVVHLRNAISEALNLALQFKPQLIAPTTRAWIDACSLTEDFPSSLPKTAKIVAAAYAPADKAAVAKTISTIEKIDSVVWLEILTKNIANVIKAIATSNDQTITDADIARISTRLHADASGQIGEFLQFLEDGALSRARLHVACELLTAIAANGDSHLKNYTARINAARAIFAAPGAEALILDASKAYGANGVADLTFSLNTTGFYDCLPIWIRPNAQIFEQRFDANLSSEREITYKLRLNGFKHAGRESKTAFEGELKALRTILSANEGNDKTDVQFPKLFSFSSSSAKRLQTISKPRPTPLPRALKPPLRQPSPKSSTISTEQRTKSRNWPPRPSESCANGPS